jgi:glycosyltransferase involved in cell wall biosynthesis
MRRAKAEGLDNCIFIDPLPKPALAEKMRAVDCGLMILANIPAFYYGTSPNKFFDYIASGLPVLNNYPGWLADLIGSSGCGLAVPPNDAASFAEALIYLADHAVDRRRMGANSRRMATASFTIEKLGESFAAFLEETHGRRV